MSQPGVNIVDFQAMTSARTQFQLTEANLKQIETSVVNAVDSLEVNWTGEAASRFTDLMRSWTDKFNDICTLMNNMEATLGGNQRALMNNEQNNTPMISNLQGQLNF